MTVYVDPLVRTDAGYRCKMFADTYQELEDSARLIRVHHSFRRLRGEVQHYVLRESNRRRAVENGAREVDGDEFERVSNRRNKERLARIVAAEKESKDDEQPRKTQVMEIEML